MNSRYAKWLLSLTFFIGSAARAEWPKEVWISSDVSSLDEFKPKPSVSVEDLKADLFNLERTAQAAYGGWSMNGTQLHAAFVRVQAKLTVSMSSEQFCQILGQELGQIPDGHLSVGAYFSEVDCMPASRKPHVGRNLTTKIWEFFGNTKGTEIPTLAISKMAWTEDPVWNGFIPKVESLYGNAKALIIDLRGNGGGDMDKAQQMARRLFGLRDDTKAIYPPSTQILPHTPEAFAVAGNPSLLTILINQLMNQPVPEEYTRGYKTYLNYFDLSLSGQLPPTEPTVVEPFEFEPEKVFKGPIRILVDANCASSCEWAVMFFERHPNSKTVGERTFGAFHFDNVGVAQMRNSHLIVNMPTIGVRFQSGHALDLERNGFVPEILVKPGEDALDVALKDIAKSF